MARFILGMLLFAAALSASAFESWEHKRLSDLAYHLAVEIHCPDGAADAMCDELRPETMVDTLRSGTLAKWCSENPKEYICGKLDHLYPAFPEVAYGKSKLYKKCQPSATEAACTEIRKLQAASRAGDPPAYRDQTAVLLWCNVNRRDEFCKAFESIANAELVNLRDIVRACALINNQSKCAYKKPDNFERLTWASFFDPLVDGNALELDNQDDDKPEIRYKHDSNLSYGDVTKCVDYFLTPEKLMAGSETALWYPTEDKQIDERKRLRSRQLYPSQREDLDLSFTKRCKDSYWNLEGARSGHVNHTHFQAELLISQRSQHLLALSLHSVERNRMAALTANAISDHYLQDSFAPGHITTWRSRLTDLAANAYHDARNRKGLYVTVSRERFTELMRPPGKGGKLHERVMYLLKNNTTMSEAKLARAYFLYPDAQHANCQRFHCEKARSVQTEVGDISKIMDKLEAKLQDPKAETDESSQPCKDKSQCVYLRGDNDLWLPSQDEQRMLMLLIQVRSILDVFESAPGADKQTNQYTMTDSFRRNNTWIWHATEEEKTVLGTRLYPPASDLEARIGPVDYQVPQAYEEDEKHVHSYKDFDPVYGVSLGFDNMTFGEQQNRWNLSVERLVFGKASEKRASQNVAAVVGLQKLFEPTSNGYGLTSRISWVMPQTETIFSLTFRELRLGNAHNNKHWRPIYGLRFDQGFTSFATMYFQISRDSAAQKDGRIDSGISVGAGVQIAAPKCRIPLVKNMCE